MKHLQLVRFRFFGAGHDSKITGHLYLRWLDDQKIWRLTEWSAKTGVRKDLEGSEYTEGALAMTSALQAFVDEWAKLQQAAITSQCALVAALKPTTPMSKPGFRPISALKVWQGFCQETQREIYLVRDDVAKVAERLWEGGWMDYPNVNFPQFDFPPPWGT